MTYLSVAKQMIAPYNSQAADVKATIEAIDVLFGKCDW